jgi:hypothetical protein
VSSNSLQKLAENKAVFADRFAVVSDNLLLLQAED